MCWRIWIYVHKCGAESPHSIRLGKKAQKFWERTDRLLMLKLAPIKGRMPDFESTSKTIQEDKEAWAKIDELKAKLKKTDPEKFVLHCEEYKAKLTFGNKVRWKKNPDFEECDNYDDEIHMERVELKTECGLCKKCQKSGRIAILPPEPKKR